MTKKIIALSLAALLLVIACVSGTWAYLKDSDGAKNVMVVGNVTIEQNETTANGAAFAQDQKLLPAQYVSAPTVDANGLLDGIDNEIDKFVSVKNTGTEDAYIRTIFLFEADGKDATKIDNVHYTCVQELVWSDFTVTLNGVVYHVATATYADPVAKDGTTAHSLKQIYLDNSVGNEWFEAVGEKYDIYAFSQAVQSAGFTDSGEGATYALDAAFGEVTAEHVTTWFGEVFTAQP